MCQFSRLAYFRKQMKIDAYGKRITIKGIITFFNSIMEKTLKDFYIK